MSDDLLSGIYSAEHLMAQEFRSSWPARELLVEGLCTPTCLLAIVEDGDCECRCMGEFHGQMLEAVVESRAVW